MTVCIGALCDNRKTAVLASDRMWTEESMLYYEFEPAEPKIECAGGKWFVATAGSVIAPDRLLKEFKDFLSTVNVDDGLTIADKLAEIFQNSDGCYK